MISILSFVYVLAQEPEAAITNLGILTTKESGLNYKFDWGETEITLHKEGNIFADIYIQNKGNGKGWKFGTTDDVHGTATYKYILESTDNLILLEKQRFDEKENLTYKYPVVYNYYHNPEDEWNEYRHIYSFEDVCSKEHAECEWKFENNILELSFVSDGNIDPAIENVSGCRTLSTANQYYQLNKSIVVTSGDCIVINNNSITLDCHGYSITSSYNVSGVYFNQPNTTIKNCNISMGTGSGGYGIEINGGTYGNASGSYIYNNTLNNQYNGIRMIGGFAVYYENLRVEKVTANSNADTGIYISPTKPLNNSVFKDITANSNGNAGIYLTSGSNNTFTNITANSNSVYGIDYSSGSYNTFAEITANSNVVGMSIGSSNDILTNLNLHSNEWGLSIFADFHNVSDSNISNSSTNDVWIGSSDNVFLNVSYNISEENVDSGSLIRKWYYRAYVNDTYGNDVLGANISIYNVSGNYMYNMATDTDGYTSIYNIIDYVNNGTAKIYYSNYTINASHPNYIVKTKTHNVAQEQNILNDNFELTQSTEIGTCGILYLANTEYNQTTNIVQTENADCIVISAQNITYNGNGYSITSDYAVSGIYSDQYNITIKNCNISMGTGGGGTGIELDGSTAIGGIAKQAKIYNNTLNSQNQGLSITQTNNSIIENNTINSNAGYGINFATTGNNNLTNNNISLNAGGGVYFSGSLSNNIKNNYLFNNTGSGAFTLYSSVNFNNFINNTIKDNSNNAISLDGSDSNNFINNTITTIFGTSTNKAFSLTGNSDHNIFKNNILNGYASGIYCSPTNTNNTIIENIISNFYQGVYLFSAGSSNNIIANNTISNGNSGIIIYSNSNRIENNVISDVSSGYKGIYLSSNSNNSVKNNIISNSLGDGINLDSSSNNTIVNNTLNTIRDYAIYLQDSNSNNFSNNYLENCSTNWKSCVYLEDSSYNLFEKGNINHSTDYSGGIVINASSSNNASHNIFRDMSITEMHTTDIVLKNASSTAYALNNTFINVSYDSESLTKNTELIRRWYYQAKVNDANSENAENAEVKAYNKTGALILSLTTGSTGYIGLGEIIDYININGVKTYYSNYTIYASNITYTASHSYNTTLNQNNYKDVFTLTE